MISQKRLNKQIQKTNLKVQENPAIKNAVKWFN